jgi:hypothetical protein
MVLGHENPTHFFNGNFLRLSLLWQDFSTFSQFLKWFFHYSILNKLNMKKEGPKNIYTLCFLGLFKTPNPFLFIVTKNVLVDFLCTTYLNVSFY